MTLTWGIVAWVLLGALLHAGWNTLVKSGSDQKLDTALVLVRRRMRGNERSESQA